MVTSVRSVAQVVCCGWFISTGAVICRALQQASDAYSAREASGGRSAGEDASPSSASVRAADAAAGAGSGGRPLRQLLDVPRSEQKQTEEVIFVLPESLRGESMEPPGIFDPSDPLSRSATGMPAPSGLETKDEEEAAEMSLDELTVQQLQELLQAHGLSDSGCMEKGDMVRRLRVASDSLTPRSAAAAASFGRSVSSNVPHDAPAGDDTPRAPSRQQSAPTPSAPAQAWAPPTAGGWPPTYGGAAAAPWPPAGECASATATGSFSRSCSMLSEVSSVPSSSAPSGISTAATSQTFPAGGSAAPWPPPAPAAAAAAAEQWWQQKPSPAEGWSAAGSGSPSAAAPASPWTAWAAPPRPGEVAAPSSSPWPAGAASSSHGGWPPASMAAWGSAAESPWPLSPDSAYLAPQTRTSSVASSSDLQALLPPTAELDGGKGGSGASDAASAASPHGWPRIEGVPLLPSSEPSSGPPPP